MPRRCCVATNRKETKPLAKSVLQHRDTQDCGPCICDDGVTFGEHAADERRSVVPRENERSRSSTAASSCGAPPRSNLHETSCALRHSGSAAMRRWAALALHG